MNYVIINGVSSTTIPGLLIQELPPVSKPPIRTTIEEIEGRDGDIITQLGFGAYDKTLTIGLYGSFNIDDIIAFFNSQGEIIFSNESDKLYRFQIVNQIDFTRLVRFRIATVTIHVQPFKYPADGSTVSLMPTTVTQLTITNEGNAYAMPAITIYGTGTIVIKLDGTTLFSIVMDSSYITIDGEETNAYCGDVFKNRQVTGSYDKLKFQPGANVLSWEGNVTKITVENFTRWI